MEAEIVVSNLTKCYSNGTEALRGINLEVKKGAFFTLLGPNGAGKSTLIKVLTTLLEKDAGLFSIDGINPEHEKSKIQRYIGVASQDNEIDPGEKVENLLTFQSRLFGLSTADAKSRTEELMDTFQLSEQRKKKAGILSGGNKRRLHCALALVHRPQVLFLDEPTVGMDPQARANFWEIINLLNQKEYTTIFLTTQYLDEADKHANAMALILDGKIEYDGTISGFKNLVSQSDSTSLDDSYLKFIQSFSK
ncbi:ABC transporter ATP-binding protein [Massilibacteroides sp.]|uniref:ABC transporter ATP-binding protein n=1 Tax=Massilibacteroides sp. TaxID=2034766 RepID=UPI00262D3F6A|nr:ABC transporter ATP-binding protein [Massilibacteroides sp.]MDD4516212.1 ABC transporter ATP-binding protein [Massilibacteroides sp.]